MLNAQFENIYIKTISQGMGETKFTKQGVRHRETYSHRKTSRPNSRR